jgi:hypothetical protein
VRAAKETYAETLRSLEAISDSVHQQREEAKLRREMGARGSGVGAETPDPPHDVEVPDSGQKPSDDDLIPGASESTTQSNAAVMNDVQAKKSQRFLSPRCKSQDDLMEDISDHDSHSSSLASASVLDDDQIQNLMMEGSAADYSKFISRLDAKASSKFKRMSLPIKLSYLENYMNFKPVWDEGRGESTHF